MVGTFITNPADGRGRIAHPRLNGLGKRGENPGLNTRFSSRQPHSRFASRRSTDADTARHERVSDHSGQTGGVGR